MHTEMQTQPLQRLTGAVSARSTLGAAVTARETRLEAGLAAGHEEGQQGFHYHHKKGRLLSNTHCTQTPISC